MKADGSCTINTITATNIYSSEEGNSYCCKSTVLQSKRKLLSRLHSTESTYTDTIPQGKASHLVKDGRVQCNFYHVFFQSIPRQSSSI